MNIELEFIKQLGCILANSPGWILAVYLIHRLKKVKIVNFSAEFKDGKSKRNIEI